MNACHELIKLPHLSLPFQTSDLPIKCQSTLSLTVLRDICPYHSACFDVQTSNHMSARVHIADLACQLGCT